MAGTLGYALKRAQVRSYELFFTMMGPDTISPARMTALSMVAAQPGISQSGLAERLAITRASVVKVVDNLELLGLIERAPMQGDRRSYALALTDEGYKELARLHGEIRCYEEKLASRLTTSERDLLMALLELVAQPED
ncbi:MarR family winged helix-turn-helix transcriptional regulator [Pantoea sp. Ap-967]|uniref:MarR family winged helix-turn-helix transcriptional regulator n=1 Tax=Pantoea sp. Ap-967 TaxID=2608362 RepID=UPI001965151F|nr:MarR family transcriptional regulator [Pantoea sp. Ap-967]